MFRSIISFIFQIISKKFRVHFAHSIDLSDKKPALKTFDEIQTLLSQGKKREVKLLIRDNAWPINSTIRSQLWPAVCSQHQVGKSMLEGYYWDMVNQVCLKFSCEK